jgi:hypothetical protein
MSYRVAYDICEESIPDADGKFLDEAATLMFPQGGRAASYWFAPEGGEDVLRADVDFDAGRAALRWLPDGSHVVELAESGAFVVLESSDSPLVTIPATLARVSPETVRRAVLEYIATGDRPTCVTWQR